jgi:hypothetical protein
MRVKQNAINFIEYAKEHDKGHVKGILMTTWFSSGELARHILYNEEPQWKYAKELAQTLKFLFE